MTGEPQVLVEHSDGIATVTLNRPGRRNGVTVEMCEELYHELRTLAGTDCRVIILRGIGDDFSVGADLAGGGTGESPTYERLGPVYHASTLLHSMPQVTIAALDGACAGAAMGWACACDFRFASDRLRLATAFLKVGVAGDMGLGWSLLQVVGGARARELLFFPEKVNAAQALEFGLVTRVFPPEKLHDEVMTLARELASRHRFPLRTMKANLVAAERLDLDDYIELESARHLHVTASPSLREGIEAFNQSRRPPG